MSKKKRTIDKPKENQPKYGEYTAEQIKKLMEADKPKK